MEIIGVDNGYGYTKTASQVFATSLKAFGEDQPPITNEVIKYNGCYYGIGTEHKKAIADKTADDETYILTLIAIAKELKQRGGKTNEEIVLAVGLPLSRTKGKLKDGFEEYFARQSEVYFEYEGTPYHIVIRKVYVFPQCIAGIINLLNDKKIKAPSVVIDIGSWTTEIVQIGKDRGRDVPVVTSNFTTIDYGMINCLNRCKNEIYAEFGKTPQDSQIQEVLQGNIGALPGKYSDIIVNITKEYVKDIIQAIEEQGFDMETLPVTLMGGGASIVKRHSEKDWFCDASYVLNVRANALGYEQWAKNKGE